MEGGLVRLRETLDKLTPSERRIAEYVLAHPETMIRSSITRLAELSGGSPAAVIRLCKSLDFSGFQEFKLKVAGDFRDDAQPAYTEITPHDSIENVMRCVSANNIQSIRDTLSILDAAAVERAVGALQRARMIHFYGMGASNLIAMDAQYKFLRINRTCFFSADPHLQIISATGMDPKDVAVCISYSGETAEIVSCMRHAKERSATTISITKPGRTTLSAMADIPLFITSTENEIRMGATASRIAQLNLIDILYLGVASGSYERSFKYLETSRRAVSEVKRRR
ncbi:MAG TPA: MurR/RpiR family transcriptional regulator [Spirochaetia bacterium]